MTPNLSIPADQNCNKNYLEKDKGRETRNRYNRKKKRRKKGILRSQALGLIPNHQENY